MPNVTLSPPEQFCSDVGPFAVSLIMEGKVSRQCPQTRTETGESKQIRCPGKKSVEILELLLI